jgi:hypothetical protein
VKKKYKVDREQQKREEVTAGERKGNKRGNKEAIRKEMAIIGGTGNRN